MAVVTKRIFNLPVSQKIVATGIDDNYNLILDDGHSGGGSLNINPLKLDFNLTLGAIGIYLPALSSFFLGGGQGLGFEINCTIVANAPQIPVTFFPFGSEEEVNTICGDQSKSLFGIGSAGKLFIAGRFNWGFIFCTPTLS